MRQLSYLLLVFLMVPFLTTRAVTKRALFIGNSYTYTNNMYVLIQNLAVSTGDELQISASVPGAFSFYSHCTEPQTLSKLAQGGWDYVVLQEQSQVPSYDQAYVELNCYPYAKRLDSLVHAYSPCAKTIFYMTWGRQNGDASRCPYWPPVCTYLGMDSLLELRYTTMADDNNAWLSPVARVWRRLRALHPGLNLYDPDGSHPSAAGSFAAACSFYAIMFGKNPETCNYDFSLSAADAAAIKTAARIVVFDSLAHWRSQSPVPVADFTTAVNGMSVQLTNNSQLADSYYWTFGDNTSSVQSSPLHTYTGNGTYNITLAAIRNSVNNCKDTTRLMKQVTTGTTGIGQPGTGASISCYPNPAGDQLFVQGLQGNESIEVYDMAGRSLSVQYKIEGKKTVLPTAGLPAGIYLLQLTHDGVPVSTLRFSKK